MKAIIKLTGDNHEMRQKSICLHTIFGDVFAPISKTSITDGVATVPAWVFYNAGLNPCQMINGFMEMVK